MELKLFLNNKPIVYCTLTVCQALLKHYDYALKTESLLSENDSKVGREEPRMLNCPRTIQDDWQADATLVCDKKC